MNIGYNELRIAHASIGFNVSRLYRVIFQNTNNQLFVGLVRLLPHQSLFD